MPLEAPPPEELVSGARSNQLHYVIHVGLRHKFLIFMTTVGAALGFYAFAYLQNPLLHSYEATAELVIRQSPWDREYLRDVSGKPLFPATPKALLEMAPKPSLAEDIARAMAQEDIAGGGALASAVDQDDINRRARDIEGRLKLDPVQETGRIVIHAVGPDEGGAARMADFAARVFIERNRELLSEEEETAHDLVMSQLEEIRALLEEADRREWEFRKEMGFQTHEELTAEIDKLNKELIETQLTQVEIAAKREEIAAQFRAKHEELPDALGAVNSQVIDELKWDLDRLVGEELALKMRYTDEHPGVRAAREEIEDKKEALLAAIQEYDAGAWQEGSVWDDRERLRTTYAQLGLEHTTLEIRAGAIQRLIDEYQARLPALAEKSFQYAQLRRDAENYRQQFNNWVEKEFDIRTRLRRGASELERATPVVPRQITHGERIQRWVMFPLGALVGLIFGFLLALMIETSDTSIQSIEDVSMYLGLEVIGTIPRMRFGQPRSGRRRGTYVSVDSEEVDACIVTQHDPKSPISEAYRALRTNFQFATIQRQPKTLMVTSAVPGEGKTTTAVNMAVTMADSGLRVLMIDTDLRRPNVHHVLKMERGPGLADVLREGLDVASVIRPTRIDNLSIISSGRVPPNPSELIGSERMQRVVQQLRARFDMVIFDAPSVLVVTDPVVLSTQVDTVALVVSVGNARRETILRAKKLLDAARATIAGVVLNGLEASRRHYYYYYYYYEDGTPRRKRWILW